jgi:hypothetical protein
MTADDLEFFSNALQYLITIPRMCPFSIPYASVNFFSLQIPDDRSYKTKMNYSAMPIKNNILLKNILLKLRRQKRGRWSGENGL